MYRSVLKIAAATAVFAGMHSALASRPAKRAAKRLFGWRKRNGLYRVSYNAVALVSLGGFASYALHQPDRELYRVRRPLAALMHSAQLYFVLYLLLGVRQVGFMRFAGFPNAIALLRGERILPPEPEGQGPAMGSGRLKIGGPFRRSRHPLNFGMLPVLWLMPRMTANLAAFNGVVTAYLIAGSWHEEKRLEEVYRGAYDDYRSSGVNFFIPRVLPARVCEKSGR